MKLKYKKIVLAVTMSTMCIGFVTISLVSPKTNKDGDSSITQGTMNSDKNTEDKNYNLECDAYPEINELVEEYLAATITGNMEVLENTVSDINHVSEEMVNNKTQIIESHQNIQCYTVKMPDQDAFITYVYSELKLAGIDTPAPGLTRLYICMSENGSYRIYLNQIDEKVQSFIEESGNSPQVQALIDKVNGMFETAVNSDEKLKAFYQQIEDTSKAEENTTAPDSTAAPDNTEAPGSTAAPDNTETPGSTRTPDNTETPDGSAAETPAATDGVDVMATDLPAEETEAAYE